MRERPCDDPGSRSAAAKVAVLDARGSVLQPLQRTMLALAPNAAATTQAQLMLGHMLEVSHSSSDAVQHHPQDLAAESREQAQLTLGHLLEVCVHVHLPSDDSSPHDPSKHTKKQLDAALALADDEVH